MKIRDVMTRPVVTVQPDTTVREATVLLSDRGVAALPVVDDGGRVLGVFTESDALRRDVAELHAPVSAVMSTPVEVVEPGADVGAVARRLLDRRLRSVPVAEHGVLVGIVARHDLLRAMVGDDDVIAGRVRGLLDDYAGSRRTWAVEVDSGALVVSGEFADEAERRVVTALAHTVAGVTSIELKTTTPMSLAWDD